MKSRVKLKCKCGLIEGTDADPVKTFHVNALAKADVIPATGDAIVTFEEVSILKALSHGAIFLATWNANLLLRDVNL